MDNATSRQSWCAVALLLLLTTDGASGLTSKSIPPTVGLYRLGMQASAVVGLTELSSAEYTLMNPMNGERIYHAPPVRFLGESWQVMLGVSEGRVFKIAPYRTMRDQDGADELAKMAISFFSKELGEPTRQGGVVIWDAVDGSVILQTGQVKDRFVVNLFLTSGPLARKGLAASGAARPLADESAAAANRSPSPRVVEQLADTPEAVASQIERWKEEVRLDPQDVEGLMAIASGYGKLHRFDEALVYCKKAVEIQPQNADAHVLLGTAYGFLRRRSEQIPEYKEAIRLRPGFARAYERLATAYGAVGQYSESLAAARKAIELDPRSLEGHFALGFVYASTGRFEEADLEQSVLAKLDPKGAADLGEAIRALKAASGKR